MRKARIGFLLAAVLLSLLVCASAFAADQRVFDDAGLFDDAQRAELEATVATMREQTGMDLVIITTADAQGKSSRDFADDYYDQNGFAADGALFLIDMDNRQAYVSTSGKMIDILTDRRIETILDDTTAELKNGNYAASADAFLRDAKGFIDQGVPAGQYRTDDGTSAQPRSLTLFEIVFALALAVVVGLIVRGSVMASYKMKEKPCNYSLVNNSAIVPDASEDFFINQTVSSVRIPRNDSGNQSSTHRSSGGNTHGGGGRGF